MIIITECEEAADAFLMTILEMTGNRQFYMYYDVVLASRSKREVVVGTTYCRVKVPHVLTEWKT